MPRSYKPCQRLYWGAKGRCNNPRNKKYALYGGRGIKFLYASFTQFIDDLGTRTDGTSLDRINPDGNYEPGNCRWATVCEQNRNKRTNVLTTYKVACIRHYLAEGWSNCDLARLFAINPPVVSRIKTGDRWKEVSHSVGSRQ